MKWKENKHKSFLVFSVPTQEFRFSKFLLEIRKCHKQILTVKKPNIKEKRDQGKTKRLKRKKTTKNNRGKKDVFQFLNQRKKKKKEEKEFRRI